LYFAIGTTYKNLNQYALYHPLLAISLGATVIEKHVIYDRSKAWEDYESAISVNEFKRFVEIVRENENVFGERSIDFTDAENSYKKTAKKFIVANKNLPKNHTLCKDDLDFKRIGNIENAFYDLKSVIGKKTKKTLNKNSPIYSNEIT
tara:strand:+ start:25 stop:468 length:444 start_codon:yes stop_codon:yes gene_type:complete